MNRRIIIAGGGASGLTAAIAAAREGAEVTVLEHMDRVGKKILSTGNGRCNLTNLVMKPEFYRCSQAQFPMQVLGQYPVRDTLSFFRELGIMIKNRNGYLYPNSEQASAVSDTLRIEAERLGVRMLCNCHVKAVVRCGRQFEVQTGSGTMKADAVILAAGSRAAPAAGSDGSGYELAAQLGHHIIKPLPALVQLRCRGKHYRTMSGVRCEARLTLMADDEVQAEDTGELQLTDYGISGIPTFQISRFAAVALDRKQQVTVLIDFLPGQTMEETARFLGERISRFYYRNCEELLLGVLNKKLIPVLLKLAGIHPGSPVTELTKAQTEQLLKLIKTYRAEVTATNSFEQAQICCGGVDTVEISPETLESRLVKGIYFAGELMDVDGICGGYNLQWAWSTGMIAGKWAGKINYDSDKSDQNASETYRGRVKTEGSKAAAGKKRRHPGF